MRCGTTHVSIVERRNGAVAPRGSDDDDRGVGQSASFTALAISPLGRTLANAVNVPPVTDKPVNAHNKLAIAARCVDRSLPSSA